MLTEEPFVWLAATLVGDGVRYIAVDGVMLSDVPVRRGGGIKSSRDCLASLYAREERTVFCTAVCVLWAGTLLVEAILVSGRSLIEY